MPGDLQLSDALAATPPLTDAQRRAITAPPGPVLVLAGPGAGKTTCLIERLQHLIEVTGMSAGRLCAVTFTNKAAGEIAQRLRGRLGDSAEDVTGGTLHRLCLDVLRKHPGHIGLRAGFGIADEEYQRALLRRLGVPQRRVNAVLSQIGRARLRGASLDAETQTLLDRYLRLLRERNLVDFDDILLLTRDLFHETPAIADATASRWDAILVDEFQDVSRVQYEILRGLARPHGHVFAVGDDEQSIYSWAGADPEVLERFRVDFAIEAAIVLDRNHRCSRQIFEVARRFVARNDTLFSKEIRADREGSADVAALAFPSEGGEADWIIADILADRARRALRWGDYAILYRKHLIGDDLEGRLLQAGIPCRLARGRALRDDRVVAQVLASLRMLLDPSDPAACDALAGLVLPRSLLDRIRARPEARDDFLGGVRLVATKAHRSDPDRKKAWRFLYHAENLQAVGRRHTTLGGAAWEILEMGLGPYRNPLEEQAQDLVDPLDYEGAQELAGRMRLTLEGSGDGRVGRIRVEPLRGLGIALQGMVAAANLGFTIDILHPGDVVAPQDLLLEAPEEGGLAVLLFKALQLLQSHGLDGGPDAYVTFDVETTGLALDSCEILEIGAARVVQGQVVDRFRSLVRPTVPIDPGARKIHGWGEEDVRDAPPFAKIWPDFRAFVGDDLLVAHNGWRFDIPLLRRQAAGLDGVDTLVFLDTLPLARSLFRESARLEDLATRFGVPPGRGHHALDDAVALAGVLAGLLRERTRRSRIAALSGVLDWLGLAIALARPGPMRPEKQRLLDICRPYTLGRYSDCLDRYEAQRVTTGEWQWEEAPPVDVVVERLGGQRLMTRLRSETKPEDRYPQSVARLERLLEGCERSTLAESIAAVLERVALSSSEGVDVDPARVQLLTLHATKGLEFDTVYIAGVEDGQIPGTIAAEKGLVEEYPEARRLLYVGMTRAKERLILTRADERFGEPGGGSTFLREMGLQWLMP